MKHVFGLVSLAVIVYSIGFCQKTIRVPQDSATIQAAINAAANGDTVLVSEGTYFVNLTINKKIVFGSLFIIDGDTSHISKTILNGGSPTRTDSASVILIPGGTDTTMVIAGFTVCNGKGTRFYSPQEGIYYRGGLGIYLMTGGATITHNVIRDNSIVSSDGLFGGGICVYPMTGPISYWIIEDNTITYNSLTSTIAGIRSGSEAGGAELSGIGRFCNNIVLENSALKTSTDALVYGNAGGLFIGLADDIEVSNNYIKGNVASSWGGAITAGGNITFKNNIIYEDSAATMGSAMHLNSGTFTLINNTIAGNLGKQALELRSSYDTLTMRLMNNILWNPASTNELNQTTGIYPQFISALCNCVRGGLTGTGNIASDPLFFSTHPDSIGWFRYNSPCRDFGVASATIDGLLLTAPATDYYGHARPFHSNPDIGAFEDGTWSGVENLPGTIPVEFTLDQNFPNPFNPSTMIRFSLPHLSTVRLTIYNILGQQVEELINEKLTPGVKEVVWSASRFPSGVYFYTVTVGGFRETKKMILLK